MSNYGLTLISEGKFDESEILLNKALNTIPYYKKKSKSLIYKDLALLYETQGQIDKTIESIKKAQQLFSDKESQYYSYLGQIQLYSRELDSLVANFEKAIELDAKNPDPYNFLGMLYMGQLINDVSADFNKALPYNQKAYELNPTPAMMENLAVNYYQIGKLNKSLQLFMQLDTIQDHNNPFTHYFIGMIYFRNNIFVLAKRYLESAIKMAPEYNTEELQKIFKIIDMKFK